MSTSRGNHCRKRSQKHQNKTAFKNDLHDTSHQTKFLNSLEISGVCKRCKDILEWKIKYKKYKPLTAPRKCVGCDQKAVKHAYHLLCAKCSTEKNVCAKCCKPIENENAITDNENTDFKILLKGLTERKRRTILRFINKKDGEQKVTLEIMSQVNEMISKMEKTNLDDDDELDGLFSDDELCEFSSDNE